jgi:predicted CopG family antitoxin
MHLSEQAPSRREGMYVDCTYNLREDARTMQKKLTISVDEAVYEGLYKVIGARKISQFIEDLVRPHVIASELDAAYAEMAADEEREREAREWAENLISDIPDETR